MTAKGTAVQEELEEPEKAIRVKYRNRKLESLYDHGYCLSIDHHNAPQQPEESAPEILPAFPIYLHLPMLACSVDQDTIQAELSPSNSRSAGYQSFRPLYTTTSHRLVFSQSPHLRTSTPSNPTRPRPHSSPPHRRLFPALNLRLLCRITSNRPLLIISSIIMIFVSLFGMITP